jgi:putative membrane-bound dehydrogenase-like protein
MFKLQPLVVSLGTCFLVGSAFAADAPVAPDVPKAPPDWKVEVLARAPQIQHPSVVVAAPDGRIFVAEDPVDMHLPSSAEADRILCFHPDGHVTVFAEKLHAVFGMLYLDGTLYVHHTPKLTIFTDDPSGVARGRTDLFDCTNPNPWATGGFNDHIPSQIRLAMDGFIYMSTGDKGIYGMVGKDGKKAELRGGGIVRFRPDGTDLEVYCTGTRNHLDFSMNDEDEKFTYDNTDDGRGWWTRFTHMVDGGFYGYPWDYWPDDATPAKVAEQIKNGTPGQPYTLWRMAEYGGGSPCGAVGYNEDALPQEYRGNLFHCEWGKGHVARFVVERSGGSYKVVKREEFLTPGGDFRPLGINPTPDGLGFLVTDWNLGGWKQASEGGKRGRLIRVTWTGKSNAAPKPQWLADAAMGKQFTASNQELIEALKHPAQSVRLVAHRRIADRGREAVAPLIALLKDTKAPPYARWHAVWALDRIDGGKAGREAIVGIVRNGDENVSVRRQAAKQLGTRLAKDASDALAAALSDPDKSLRFQAATALGRVADVRRVPDLLNALDEEDLFTRYAAFHALNRIGRADPAAWNAITSKLSDTNERVRSGALFAMRATYAPQLVQALLGYVSDTQHPAAARGLALTALAPLHRQPKAWEGRWWGTQPVLSPRPKKEVEWEGTETVVRALRDGLNDPAPEVRLAAVQGLQVAPDPQVGDQLAQMFQQANDAATRKELLKAVTACKPESAAQFVEKILTDPNADPALVPDAITVAEKSRGMAPVLAKAAGAPNVKPQLVVAALEALTRMRDRSFVDVATKLVTDANRPVEVRRAAAEALAASRSSNAVGPLLKAYGDQAVRRDVILALANIPDVRALDAYLEGLDSKDGTLRQKCRDALKQISGQALPLVEAKLDKQPFSTQAIADLQAVFTAQQPIREWKVLGPWPSDAPDPFPLHAFDSPAPGGIKAPDGRELRWRTVRGRGPDGVIDLGSAGRAEAYAYAELNADAERHVEFRVGSDDRLTLFVNGEPVYQDLNDSGWSPDEATVSATLKPGHNVILAKVGNAGGGWMFSVAVSGERKGKLFEYNTKSLDPAAYAQFATTHPGDAKKGDAIFHSLQGVACAKCHQVNGQGGEAGPALTGVGAKYNRAQLVESVLYPSKQIFDGYQQTLIRTKDGNTYAGSVRGETQDELTLLDAENRKTVIRKSTIDRRKVSELSLMPEGLHTGLKPQEFADLISYLESLKEPAPAK